MDCAAMSTIATLQSKRKPPKDAAYECKRKHNIKWWVHGSSVSSFMQISGNECDFL